jgi:hypothetical protein
MLSDVSVSLYVIVVIFRQVKMEKSNGQCHVFDVLRSDAVYRGDISLPNVLVRYWRILCLFTGDNIYIYMF